MTLGGKWAMSAAFGTAILMAWHGAWLAFVLFMVAGFAVIQEERNDG